MESIYNYDLKKDFCVIRYDLDTWHTNIIQGHWIPFDQRRQVLFIWSMSQIGLNGKYICSEQCTFAWSDMTLTLWLTTFIQVGGTFFDHRHSVNEVWAMLDQGKKRYAPDKDFVYIILPWPQP